MFLIKEVYLKNFNYIKNNGISELHYTPKELLQFIIGSNGSGKSSLATMLIPHVPVGTIFSDDGVYRLVIDRDGVEYKLEYVKSPKPFFSFHIDGGENLNEGGTGTVQRKLIEYYINIEQDVIGILLGTERFTSMTPARRKHWMSRLSPTNVDAIISAFTKVNEKIKSTTNNIQFLQKKVLQATENLNRLGTDNGSMEQKELVSELLNQLYPLKTKIPNLTPLETLSDSIAKVATDYISVVDRSVESIAFNDTVIHITQLDTIDNAINFASQEYELAKQSYLIKAEELTHLTEDISAFESMDTLDTLSQKLAKERSFLSAFKEEFALHHPDGDSDCFGFDAELARDTLLMNHSALLNELIYILDNLKSDKDGILNKNTLLEKEKYLERLYSDKALLESEIAQARNTVIGCNNAEHVSCKRCGNEWKIGYTDEEVLAAKDTIAYKSEHLDIITGKIEVYRGWVESYQTYTRDISLLVGIGIRYPILQTLINTLTRDEILKHNPKRGVEIIPNYLDKLEYIIKINKSTKAVAELEDKLSTLNAKSYTDIEGRYQRKLSLEQDLVVLETSRKHYQVLVTHLKQFKQNAQQYQAVFSELSKMGERLERYDTLYSERVEAMMVDSLITELQITLGKLSEDLAKRTSLTRTISELEANLIEEKGYLEQYKMLAEGLGPTGGLLAEQLSVSINAIVEGINSIISKLWKSELYIIPCGIEEGELTYRFPFNGINSKDVSEGSNGQRDMVDLAFRIMVYQLLGLKQFPLFLDEMGCFFDKEHKGTLTRYITECLEDGTFSQVFYITHAIEQYIGAATSDINVLCERNVTLPAVYNTNLKLL